MAALQDELRGSLDECWTHVSALFGTLAQRTELSSGAEDGTTQDIAKHYAALEGIDKRLRSQLERAAEHAENQRRLDVLVARVQARDTSMRAGIAHLATLRDELYAMVAPAEDELARLDEAEKEPLRYQDILEYAQRLARYTSAPPGYRLGAPQETPAEYNSSAARAAGYYNPTIPGMLQELPFPSDMVMRQGILYEDAANAAGAAATEHTDAAAAAANAANADAAAADAAAAATAGDADNDVAAAAAAAPAHAAIDAFGADDDDDLDLDLNP
ncbi:hypothetical protein MCUN1_002325 [Malassezia cuniculi]|uniref:Mediator of RNA polymerase II transcription subunit 4 n=1 Tax=Malassezia cuniculi TaxID=948313 RepID=A0AAF0EUP6_9BASI|nr:hypothetical protein MCUN1_002325 [Malassezia cuniculi]